ncbi:Vitamin B12 transporter BtuB [Sporomusa carbonis]
MNPGYQKDVKPEQGMSYELGAEQKVSDKYNTKLTLYYQNIDDYINFEHTYPFFIYNVDKVNVWGAEWENVYNLDNSNRLIFNYTNQHTKQEGTDQSEFDYSPRHKIALAYQYDAKPWQVRYTVNYTGNQKASYGKVTLSSYTIHNLAVVRELDPERTLSLYVDNLFDKDYVEQYGYPMQGRSYYVSLTQKL